jgi:uncharacterized protein (DUF1684 family)
MVAGVLLSLAAALPLAGAAPEMPAGPDTTTAGLSAYRNEIDAWHRNRIEGLRGEDGWLTLVGLHLLHEGDNRFGSAGDNDLALPAKAPARAGVIRLSSALPRGLSGAPLGAPSGAVVSVTVNEGITITCAGERVRSMPLKTDAEGEPTTLAMGSLRFFVIERAGHLYLRVKDNESEALRSFIGIERFPVDPRWRIEGRFEPYHPPKAITIPNVLGYTYEDTCPGAIAFTVQKKACRLEPTRTSNGGFFVVFADETSGRETYGGGRFLYVAPPDTLGRVIVDFNKSYNPPCAFTLYATCPLPHPANILSVRVEAGEKTFAGGH